MDRLPFVEIDERTIQDQNMSAVAMFNRALFGAVPTIWKLLK